MRCSVGEISQVHDWIEWLKSNNSPGWAEWAHENVLNAPIFYIGKFQELPPPRIEALAMLRPPFPRCVVEYGTIDADPCSRVLLYCEEIKGEEGYLCQPAQKMRSGGWVTGHPLLGRRAPDGTIEFQCDLDASDQGVRALQAAWFFAAHAFNVMRCVNVIMVDHPAPEKLNKKRLSVGKQPLLSFKTLHINVPNRSSDGPPLGGSHSSPRLHLRRGHIRRLPGQRQVWVQSCVVGSSHGVVVKDYALVSKNGDHHV